MDTPSEYLQESNLFHWALFILALTVAISTCANSYENQCFMIELAICTVLGRFASSTLAVVGMFGRLLHMSSLSVGVYITA